MSHKDWVSSHMTQTASRFLLSNIVNNVCAHSDCVHSTLYHMHAHFLYAGSQASIDRNQAMLTLHNEMQGKVMILV